MIFKKTLRKVHDVVDKGSKDIQKLVKKAEGFVDQTEDLIKASDNGIKIMVGFVVVAMTAQILASYTQLRVNTKLLWYMRGIRK